MTGRASRTKGVRGERESADVFRAHGFEVVRLQNNVLDAGDYTATRYETGGLDGFPQGSISGVDTVLLVDSKRRERLHLGAASKQIEAVARDGQIPCVVYRRNSEPWRVSLLLEDFARLVGT